MKDESYDVASAEARAGRRGLLDSGPHAPMRQMVGRGLRVSPAMLAQVREQVAAVAGGLRFEVGAPVFILADPAPDAYGPYAGESGGRVVEVVRYPAPYPALYVVRTPGRADHPYIAERLRRARCFNPTHQHDDRAPMFLCPDRGRAPDHGSGMGWDLDAGV